MPTTLGTAELHRRVVAILEGSNRGLAGLGGSGSTVGAMLSWLEREELSPAEVMDILGRLRTSGHLSEFLNLVSHRDLRRYLREHGVPWVFVLQNWEPSVNDSGTFFAGFVVGAGESLTDVLRLVVTLVGAPFSAELARERDQFWATVQKLASPETFAVLRRLASSPEELARLALKDFEQELGRKLWNLEFFEAGRQLGSFVTTLLTIITSLGKLPKALKALGRLAEKAVRLSVAQLRSLGLTVERLKSFFILGVPQLATDTGYVLALSGEDAVILDRAGSPVGKIARSEVLGELGGGGLGAVAARGFKALSQSARIWLADHRLTDLAEQAMVVGTKYLDEGVEAIERLQRSTGFEEVIGNWLRGIQRTDLLGRNQQKGAAFVFRYCLAELKDVDPWKIVFESGVSRLYERYTDILLPGLKIEMKSVKRLSRSIVKQLVRDIVTNIGDDLSRLKGIRFVFDSEALTVTRAELIDTLKAQLARHPLFRPGRFPSSKGVAYPRLEEIQKLLDEIVVLWP